MKKAIAKELKEAQAIHVGVTRNEKIPVYSDHDKEILDFYSKYDPFEPTLIDQEEYDKYMTKLSKDDIAILEADYNY